MPTGVEVMMTSVRVLLAVLHILPQSQYTSKCQAHDSMTSMRL